MKTATIEMPKWQAKDLFKKYRRELPKLTKEDKAVMRAAHAIWHGHQVIDLIQTIQAGGRWPKSRLPKLAIARASLAEIHCELRRNGTIVFCDDFWNCRWRLAVNTKESREDDRRALSIVPLIPVPIRPKNLKNYFVLWEAEWEDVPADPILLRRLEKSNLFVVLASWNLTELERAVLRQRL